MKIALCGFPQCNFFDFFKKNYEMDYIDIYNMNLKEYSKLKDYDLIILYIISGLQTVIPLHEIAGKIKHVTKKPIFLFFDYEANKSYNSIWKNTFDSVDRIFYVSPINRLGLEEIKDKCKFFPLPVNSKPIEVKYSNKKWVAIIRHTSPISDLEFSLKVLSELGYPVKWFTGWHGTDAKINEKLCGYFKIKEYKCYPRLDTYEYYHELSDCYIGLDVNLGYIGWSRFVTECTIYGIPVVSTFAVSSNVIANPKLVSDKDEMVIKKLKFIYENEDYRNECGKEARSNLLPYISYESCKKRFEEIIKEVGL